VSGALVGDLGIGPDIWLFLSLLCCVTLFFKFSRIWSVRNLDLLLLFALTPGMMGLVGNHEAPPWSAFVWLFLGSAMWLVRCMVDLGMPRRPLLEPNLNAAGLACLSIGVLGLLLLETVSLPLNEGAARNPAEPGGAVDDEDFSSESLQVVAGCQAGLPRADDQRLDVLDGHGGSFLALGAFVS